MVHTTLHLQNTGSTARDHLANERTFLAWLRTSLTFASAGIAITQLFRLRDFNEFGARTSAIIGSLFVAAGIILMVLGTFRYFHVQSVLQEKLFPATRGIVLFAFSVSFALVAAALGVLIKLNVDSQPKAGSTSLPTS